MKSNKTTFFLLIVNLILWSGCAYFNTFYNAREYFQAGKKEFAKSDENNNRARQNTKNFDLAIEKSNKVLMKYPESKWIDNAQYIIALSYYYKGNYTTAKEHFEKFISEYPQSELLPELQIWYGRNFWKSGNDDLALRQWKKTAKTINKQELLAEIYFSIGELFRNRNSLDSTIHYYKKITDFKRGTSKGAQAQFQIAEIYLEQNDIEKAIENLKRITQYNPSDELKNKMQVLLVKIYRESGQYDEARKIILKKLSRENNKDIWGALELQMALIYNAEGDFESGESRLKQVTENYPRTPESAEAYYTLGYMNMTILHNYEEAQKDFQKVSSEDSKSKFCFEANQKASELKRYFSIKSTFDKVAEKVKIIREGLLSREDVPPTEVVDTTENQEELKKEIEEQEKTSLKQVDTLATFKQYYQSLYELAELYYFNFEQQDSAIKMFEDISQSQMYNPLIDKSVYALWYIYEREGDSSKTKLYYDVLKNDFPDSPYLSFIDGGTIKLPKEFRIANELYCTAENYFDAAPDSAIEVYQKVFEKYLNTIYGEKSLMSIAWLYHHKLLSLDSTIVNYQAFLDTFPESEFYRDIKSEYDKLQALIESMKSDSTETESNELSENGEDVPAPTDEAGDAESNGRDAPVRPDRPRPGKANPPNRQGGPQKTDEKRDN